MSTLICVWLDQFWIATRLVAVMPGWEGYVEPGLLSPARITKWPLPDEACRPGYSYDRCPVRKPRLP